VSWFQLQRNTPPYGDNVYTTYARTAPEHGFADDELVTSFGPRSFSIPENTTSRWRIRVLINYYNAADTQIVGRIRGVVEVYEHVVGGTDYTIGLNEDGDQYDGYCREEFWPVPTT
jgi:hypothetical protein